MAISVWAKPNAKTHIVYCGAIVKRFEFAKWMFEQSGFSPQEAGARSRLMVTSLIGESTASLKAIPN